MKKHLIVFAIIILATTATAGDKNDRFLGVFTTETYPLSGVKVTTVWSTTTVDAFLHAPTYNNVSDFGKDELKKYARKIGANVILDYQLHIYPFYPGLDMASNCYIVATGIPAYVEGVQHFEGERK